MQFGGFWRIFSLFYYHSYLKLCTKNVSQLVVETDYKLYPLVLKHCFIVVVFLTKYIVWKWRFKAGQVDEY